MWPLVMLGLVFFCGYLGSAFWNFCWALPFFFLSAPWCPHRTLSFLCSLTLTAESSLQRFSNLLTMVSFFESILFFFPPTRKNLLSLRYVKMGKEMVKIINKNLLYVEKLCAKDCGCRRIRCWGNSTTNNIFFQPRILSTEAREKEIALNIE